MKAMLRACLAMFILCTGWAYGGNTWYLVTHGSQDPYWHDLFQGARKAAEDLKIDVQILAPAGANDIPKQLQFLESAIAAKPLGIATTIPSETAFSKSLQRARKSGIPVIAIDTRPEDNTRNPYLAFVGSDNRKAGEALASLALSQAPKQARALILNPQPGHSGLELRSRGIRSALEAHHIPVDILDTGVDTSQVQSRVTAWFLQHPDTTLVFCLTSQALDPVGQILLQPQRYHFEAHPEVYSFDLTPNTRSLITRGLVRHAVDQQPFLMGYYSILQLVMLNRQQGTPVNINTAA